MWNIYSQLTLYTGENLQIAVSYLAIVMQSNSYQCILSTKDNNHRSKSIYEEKKKPNLAQDFTYYAYSRNKHISNTDGKTFPQLRRMHLNRKAKLLISKTFTCLTISLENKLIFSARCVSLLELQQMFLQ